MDSSDLSLDGCANTFSMWRFTSSDFASLANLKSLKGHVTADKQCSYLGTHAIFQEGAGRRDRGLGAQIGIPRVRTHPSQTLEFLVKVHRAQERALHRAANMTEAQLAVDDAEHDVVDQLLDDFTVLRLEFYERVENATARVTRTE
jgi:hypothetical protein